MHGEQHTDAGVSEGDLASWRRQRGPLAVEEAVDLMLQVCEAVAEARSVGIVRRELRLADLLVARLPDGSLTIKWRGSGADAIKGIDAPADIWALGVILDELVGGARLDVPPALKTIISCCLEKNRDLRFATVEELATALLPFGTRRARASVERISGMSRGTSPSTSPLVASLSQGRLGDTSASGRRSTPLLIAGAAAMLAVVGAGTVLARFMRAGAAKASATAASTPASASELPVVADPQSPTPVPSPVRSVAAPAPSASASAGVPAKPPVSDPE